MTYQGSERFMLAIREQSFAGL